MNHPGLFIVLEGADGAGKSTQLKLIEGRLKALGYDVLTVQFPNYKSNSSYFVRQYLAGKYGPAGDVSPYTAAMFYALDRYEQSPKIREALKDGRIVLADRYAGSNMAHQGSKFSSSPKKRGFFLWVENLEYETMGIPRPDINFYLHLPTNISTKRIESRARKNKTKADEHEKDHKHLSDTVNSYSLLSKLFPKDFIKINCAKKSQQLGVIEVNDLIWNKLKPILPLSPPHRPKTLVVKFDAKLVVKKPKKQPKKNK